MKNNIGKCLIVCVLGLSVCSCEQIDRLIERLHPQPISESVVVSVGTNMLYEEDLKAVTVFATNAEDSAKIADEYIRGWATERLVYESAKKQLGARKELDDMVEDYKRSLYVHEYEQQLLNKRVSQEINADSMATFYEREKNTYILTDNIIKGIVIIVPRKSPQQDKLLKWLKNYDEDIDQVEHYAYQFASSYQIFTENWQLFSKLLSKMPLDEGTALKQLKNKKTDIISASDSASLYLLRITDRCFEGEQMPFDYAEPFIRHSIIDKRKLDYLKNYEQTIYLRWRDDELLKQQNKQQNNE
ncbi:MAG: hypothetical protein IJS05_08035 [Paludibacteraceae bacterium]|nr:hypothetical protein [Paludibacteraceae bacterium]